MLSNGWKKFEKPSQGRSYNKYKSQMVVIVAGEKTKNVYISNEILKLLGNPTHIDIYTRGSNVGIFASHDKTGYKLQKGTDDSMQHISGVTFVKAFNLEIGVYTAHHETGKVVFDLEQTPVKP